MTKREWLRTTKPITITIDGQTLIGQPRRFSTGKLGFNVTGKVSQALADGSTPKGQFNGNLVLIGSDGWAEGGDLPQLPAPGSTAGAMVPRAA